MQVFNPYLPSWEYVPDGEPHVFGDRVYVFGSHDRFNAADFCLNDYVCWSAPVDDLSDWSCSGVMYETTQDPRNKDGKMHMCAPDVIRGKDGRYYLYYQLHVLTCTSVAVADKPEGPYEFYGYVQHPDGKPWGEKKGDAFAFDPGVLIDDDGKIYLYIGFAPKDRPFRMIMKMRGINVDGGFCLELADDMITVIGEQKPTIPGHFFTKNTGFEGHGFFEASSPRKINDKYYLIYSSELSHELCYAVSDSPTENFQYGGTIVSIGDIGFNGRTEADNYTGNTHGGLVQIEDQWYVFYHRQTNKQKCARQGCAEKITILNDGSIPQVEMTSCGLNQGTLRGEGTYEARIACELYAKEGTFAYLKTFEKDKDMRHPYFTQSGEDREENGDQYIANMRDGAVAGYKYFDMNQNTAVSVRVRGDAGTIEVLTDPNEKAKVMINITPSENWKEFTAEKYLDIEDSKTPLYFRYRGKGHVVFDSFTLSCGQ